MTNPLVGTVYQQIIKDVVETSRVDFEEGGVDESVLEELATVSFSILSRCAKGSQMACNTAVNFYIPASI